MYHQNKPTTYYRNVKQCKCGYAIEDCRTTSRIHGCLLCARKGIESPLIPRTVYYPERPLVR